MATPLKQTQGIQSLEIGARVLHAVQLAQRPLALKDVAQASGLSASQAHRYLTSWLRTGFVAQEPSSGNYLLGDQSLSLGLAALKQHDTLERAAAQLAHLVDELGETAVMSVWCAEGPICVRWLRGQSLLGTDAGLGTIFPIAGSAAGLAFAAHLSPKLVLPLLIKQTGDDGNTKQQSTDAKIKFRKHTQFLDANRAAVLENGYAQARGHFVSGLSAMAAPVFDVQGQMVASIGVIVREATFASREIAYATALKKAARLASMM